jgi:hypothetical protein
MGALTPVVSDPTGEVYGFPTYRWGDAPEHLMTRRQLTKAGLRKGGQNPVAEMRIYAEGWQVAYLYDSRTAPKRRPWTPAKQVAVQKAADSRKWCGTCRRWVGYVPHHGECNTCTDARSHPDTHEEKAA